MTTVQRRTIAILAINGLIMTVLAIVLGLGYLFGQDIEHAIFGNVVRIPKADQVWRGFVTNRGTGREVEVGCFRLHGLHKLSEAVDPKYYFKVRAKLSDPLNVSAYVADAQHQETGDELRAHDVGVAWDRQYCFEMPGTIGDDQRLTVSGRAEHIRLALGIPWPFWRTVTPVPEFVIKPEFCYESAAPASDACEDDASR